MEVEALHASEELKRENEELREQNRILEARIAELEKETLQDVIRQTYKKTISRPHKDPPPSHAVAIIQHTSLVSEKESEKGNTQLMDDENEDKGGSDNQDENNLNNIEEDTASQSTVKHKNPPNIGSTRSCANDPSELAASFASNKRKNPPFNEVTVVSPNPEKKVKMQDQTNSSALLSSSSNNSNESPFTQANAQISTQLEKPLSPVQGTFERLKRMEATKKTSLLPLHFLALRKVHQTYQLRQQQDPNYPPTPAKSKALPSRRKKACLAKNTIDWSQASLLYNETHRVMLWVILTHADQVSFPKSLGRGYRNQFVRENLVLWFGGGSNDSPSLFDETMVPQHPTEPVLLGQIKRVFREYETWCHNTNNQAAGSTPAVREPVLREIDTLLHRAFKEINEAPQQEPEGDVMTG